MKMSREEEERVSASLIYLVVGFVLGVLFANIGEVDFVEERVSAPEVRND